jgi:hypothetical protein
MKTYGGVELQLHAFLAAELGRRDRSASRRRHFAPGEREPGNDWIGDLQGPRAGMGPAEKRRIFCFRL